MGAGISEAVLGYSPGRHPSGKREASVHLQSSIPDNFNTAGANAISVDLESARVEQSIDQDETSAGNEVQIVNERIDRGGTTGEQSSLFNDNGHLGQGHLNLGLDHHLGEIASDLDASGIEALRNTPEELFLLRHYSECIAPWYGLLEIHCMITS